MAERPADLQIADEIAACFSGTYSGRPIMELTREELIEAVTTAVRHLEQLQEIHRQERELAATVLASKLLVGPDIIDEGNAID